MEARKRKKEKGKKVRKKAEDQRHVMYHAGLEQIYDVIERKASWLRHQVKLSKKGKTA